MKRALLLAAFLAVPILGLLLPGCEVGSADSVVREMGIDFSGFYVGAEGGALVSKNSGKAVEALNLRQNGDQLEAIDNNNSVYRGRLGNVVESTASFTMEGATTAGQPVTLSGTLQGEGTSATLRGTWIEPDFYATISGVGTINPAPTNTNELAISPSSANLSSDGATVIFTVSGGTPTYTWGVANTNGTLSSTTGSSVTYTRQHAGENTVSVDDSAGKSASATITQP